MQQTSPSDGVDPAKVRRPADSMASIRWCWATTDISTSRNALVVRSSFSATSLTRSAVAPRTTRPIGGISRSAHADFSTRLFTMR